MYSEITLIAETITVDEYRRECVTEAQTVVFAEVNSITQSEYFAAQNVDLRPEFKFSVFFGDYSGEKVIEYEGDRYGVYRTYLAGDYMELYAERKVGRDVADSNQS